MFTKEISKQDSNVEREKKNVQEKKNTSVLV